MPLSQGMATGAELGVIPDSIMEAQLRQEAEKLFREIYQEAVIKKGWGNDLAAYWHSMKLREDDPSVYESGKYTEPGMNADEMSAYLIDTSSDELISYRHDEQVAGLYYYHQFGVLEGLVGKETCIIRVSEEYIRLTRQLQDAMMREVNSKKLIIETNPSSNVLIGTFKDYCLHPIFRFNNRKLLPHLDSTGGPDKVQLNVCVNTDDLGVFDTNLEFEYALLYEALQKRRESSEIVSGVSGCRYSDNDILDYLDDLREMGLKAVFS